MYCHDTHLKAKLNLCKKMRRKRRKRTENKIRYFVNNKVASFVSQNVDNYQGTTSTKEIIGALY